MAFSSLTESEWCLLANIVILIICFIIFSYCSLLVYFLVQNKCPSYHSFSSAYTPCNVWLCLLVCIYYYYSFGFEYISLQIIYLVLYRLWSGVSIAKHFLLKTYFCLVICERDFCCLFWCYFFQLSSLFTANSSLFYIRSASFRSSVTILFHCIY